jgi:hypothetical protein
MVRGGATRDPEVKSFLKEQGFMWDGDKFAWYTYLDRSEFGPILKTLRDHYGCEVVPKSGMDESYLIDLDSPSFSRPKRTPTIAEENMPIGWPRKVRPGTDS